jgi:hypothetical protein
MEAYDSLPRIMRDALKETSFDISAHGMKVQRPNWQSLDRATLRLIAESIQRQDREFWQRMLRENGYTLP